MVLYAGERNLITLVTFTVQCHSLQNVPCRLVGAAQDVECLDATCIQCIEDKHRLCSILDVEFARNEGLLARSFGEQCKSYTVFVRSIIGNGQICIGFPEIVKLLIGKTFEHGIVGLAYKDTCGIPVGLVLIHGRVVDGTDGKVLIVLLVALIDIIIEGDGCLPLHTGYHIIEEYEEAGEVNVPDLVGHLVGIDVTAVHADIADSTPAKVNGRWVINGFDHLWSQWLIETYVNGCLLTLFALAAFVIGQSLVSVEGRCLDLLVGECYNITWGDIALLTNQFAVAIEFQFGYSRKCVAFNSFVGSRHLDGGIQRTLSAC